jgi:transposase-like protein
VVDRLLAGRPDRGRDCRARWRARAVDRAAGGAGAAAELSEHLGCEPPQEPLGGVGNTRNGSTPKTLQTERGPVGIGTPRDRSGGFDPRLVRKGQRRFEGFDDKILALYSRGLSMREIEAHLAVMYGVRVGGNLVGRVTDAVMEDVREWRQRPLDDERSRRSTRRRSCRPAWGRSKPIYLAITNAVPAWTRTRNRTTALLAFTIHFGDQLPE